MAGRCCNTARPIWPPLWIMGTEVEYGISVPGDATANPVLTSTQVVLAYA
ncbi:proteasome accessory factor PafA2 family protein, partial [Lentzea indica]